MGSAGAPPLPADVLAAYQRSRAPGVDRSVLCHAPFASLNFDQSGQVTACCYNRHFRLGSYPEQSIREIWTGAPAQALRAAFRDATPAPGCDSCFDQLRSGNFSGALMRNFDRYDARARDTRSSGQPPGAAGPLEVPLVLEFEIANTCALECVMCGGHWSSAIRARRERLPPLRNPYDRAFLAQVEELLPQIVAAKFLGGEPFLIPAYLEIWDGIRRLNPEAEVSITTSGSVLPDRQRQLLEQLRASIVVSLDGITRATYEAIRRNASFDQVMENVRYFRDYTRRRGTSLTVAVCPMTHNWRELPAIVAFCEEHRMSLFFNTVTFPLESSLAGLDESALAEVIDVLATAGADASRAWAPASRAQWQGLLNQLRGWWSEKRAAADRAAAVTAAERRRGAQNRDERERGVIEARRQLVAEALDPVRRTAVEHYLESLVTTRCGPPDMAESAPQPGRVRDLPELINALVAARLFHCAFGPAETHEAFRRRLDQIAAVLTPEVSGELQRLLRDADVRAIYEFLSSAPDAEFASALRAFEN